MFINMNNAIESKTFSNLSKYIYFQNHCMFEWKYINTILEYIMYECERSELENFSNFTWENYHLYQYYCMFEWKYINTILEYIIYECERSELENFSNFTWENYHLYH